MGVTDALLLLGLLTVKHMLADYFLQTGAMLANRGLYLHAGRAAHCAVHVVCTAICFGIMGLPLGLSLVVMAAEFVVHFHIDWAKGKWSDVRQHGPADAGYWRAFGVDQTLHQLTYVAMVLVFL